MCKKILIVMLLCIFAIHSFIFADSAQSDLSIYLGDTVNLKNYLEKEQVDIPLNDNTIIQISDPQIFSVDSYYNIKTTSVGESLLVLVNNDDFLTINIKVKSPIKEILISDRDLTLIAGEIYPLNFTLISHDDYHKPIAQQLKWTNSKPRVLGIKGGNKLYTHGVGTTILTGKTLDGSQSVSLNIQVIGNPDNLVIQTDIIDNYIRVGDNRQLKAFFGTKDVTRSVEWESEFPEIATVDDNGLVYPLKAGTCEITAQSSIDRKKKTYTFFVRSMVEKIELNRSSIVFENVGDTKQLQATLTYKTPNVKPLLDGYYYKSSNPSVVSVDDSGIITATGKGLALVYAISNDSQLKDACTIEVLGEAPETSIDYTTVQEIYLDASDTETLIGHKVPLQIDIRPTDATDQSVKFDIRGGDVSQIKFIDGQYYFVPHERGIHRIKVVANGAADEVSDTIEIQVQSPLASLNLDITTDRGTTSERKLYIGEETELINTIYTQGHYTAFDVYPSTLEYTVDDTDILDLNYINGKYYLRALKKGTTTVRVEDIEGRFKESLKIKVSNPIDELYSNREVRLPLGFYYTPEYWYDTTYTAKDAPITYIGESIKLEIEDFYFKESYIDGEIAYEEMIIDQFKQGSDSPTTLATIDRHNTRLNRLMQLKNSAENGYCLLSTSFLKNRSFNTYDLYDINGSQIRGNFPSKALVTLSINGTSKEAQTVLYWQDDQLDFAIKPSNRWENIDVILENNKLTTTFISLDNNKKINYLSYYLAHQEIFDSVLDLDLLAAFASMDTNKLPNTITADLNAPTTKHELAYVISYLNNAYNTDGDININNIVYYDVIDDTVKQQVAKGYIKPASSDYLGVNKIVSYEEFKNAVNLILPNNNLPPSMENTLDHQTLLILLNQL